MTLRRKTLLFVVLLWLTAFVVLFGVLWRAFDAKTAHLQKTASMEDLQRLVTLVTDERRALATAVKDLAYWDDASEYVRTRDVRFEKSNLVPDTYGDNRVNVILVATRTGEIVYRHTEMYHGHTPLTIREFEEPRLRETVAKLLTASESGIQSGFLWTSAGPMLLAAGPIKRSDGSGDAVGMWAMGRLWDSAELDTLQKSSQVRFGVYQFLAKSLPAEEREWVWNNVNMAVPKLLTAETPPWVGYCLLSDLFGQPAGFLKASFPCPLYQSARADWGYLSASVLLIAGVFGVLLVLLVERTVLQRLAQLSKTVQEISTPGDFSRRAPAMGTDEIGMLASETNVMFERLQHATHALAVSEERHRRFLGNFPGIAYEMAPNGEFRLLAGAVESMTGYGAADFLAGRVAWLALVTPETRPAVATARERCWQNPGSVVELSYRLRRADGRCLHLQEQLRAVASDAGLVAEGTVYDVTAQAEADAQRRELEEQHRLAQHLEAIGLLASGVAHDFNNVLQGIIGHNLLARRCCPPDVAPKLHQHLDTIAQAAQRAAALVRDLLTFCQRSRIDSSPVVLNDAVRDVRSFIEQTFPRNIEIKTDLDPAAGTVTANPSLVVHVLLNLAVNARDAMPEGGTLTFCTRRNGQPPNGTAELTVSDTGTGMTPEVRNRIFEPFFTTKPPGSGTGLGLSMAYGAVQSWKAQILCDSAPGKGTTFVLRFPLPADSA